MVLVILATLMILAIAYFQITQGFFSSVILALLSVLAAALSLNYYEPVAASLFYEGHPLYAEAITLVLLFSLPLIAVRFLVDKYVPSNVVLGMWADRIGSAVFGVIIGMVGVGILMLAMQMLPFSESVLTYRPFNDQLQRDQHLGPFRPDDFVLGLGRTLSAGSLSSEREFGVVHDDLLLKLFCDRNRAGLKGRFDTPPETMIISGIYAPAPTGPTERYAAWLRTQAPPNPLLSKEENDLSRVLVFRVVVLRLAADEPEETRDEKRQGSWWRLPATQFRLAWHDGRNFYPVAYLTSPWGQHAKKMTLDSQRDQWRMWIPPADDNGNLEYTKLGVIRPVRLWGTRSERQDRLVMDWVFRVPAELPMTEDPSEESESPPAGEDEEEAVVSLRPTYLAFRRVDEVLFNLDEVQPISPPKGAEYGEVPLSHARYAHKQK